VWSTYPVSLDVNDGTADGYTSLSGTSMATPHVTGAAALVLAKQPDLTPWQLGQALVSSADKVPALATQVASGGRLNAAAALGITPPPASQQPAIAPATTPTATPVQQPTAPTTPAPQPAPAAPQPAPAPVSPAPTTPAPTTTTPVAAVDRTAPTVALSLSTRGALTALLKGRLRVTTTVSERASVRVEVRLDARTAKKLHLKAGKTGVRIATGSASATGTATVKLKLTSAAKRALARVRSVKATVTATATDAAGNRGTRSRKLTIRR
jgi:hypothetical protein